jgi:acetyl-CoA decarbonylase/synthase complex subunit delta
MPVTVETTTEKWTGSVREVTLGATADEGGTRTRIVTVGGETSLPFLHFEGKYPHPPAIAIEIQNSYPEDWSPLLLKAWGDVTRDPAAWAKKAEEIGADLIMLKLRETDSSGAELTTDQAVTAVEAVLKATGLPLIVRGPGQVVSTEAGGGIVLVAVAEAASGERIALGLCEDKNYRTTVAAALAHNHLVIASTPIDVNLAKQLNILISDMAMPLERVLMDPTTGALGYGLEYSYSVMERLRLAALQGDSMTQQPMICFVGEESWRQKESKVGEDVPETWGDWYKRAVTWEATTAISLLNAGADIITLRHPDNVPVVRRAIDKLMGV